MSLGLQATKRRINSVNSTKKITNAMSVVATAKLKSWRDKLNISTSYADEMKKLIKCLFASLDQDEVKDFFSQYESKSNSTLYVLITSSLGLCAGYNYNLFKKITPEIKKEDKVLVIGTKGLSFVKRKKYNYDDRFVNAYSGFDYSVIRKLASTLLTEFKLGKCKNIKICYTQYKNSLSFIPVIDDLFPITIDESFKEGISTKDLNMLIEPDAKTILNELIPLYIKSSLYSDFVESAVSEQSSRRNAMDNATDNAEEIVNNLMLEYNKARQAAITREITEIVAGANALK